MASPGAETKLHEVLSTQQEMSSPTRTLSRGTAQTIAARVGEGMIPTPVGRARQISAFIDIAASLTQVERLEEVLGLLAGEVRAAVGLEYCAVALVDLDGRVRTAGTSNLSDDYAELLEACRSRGAPIITIAALEQNEVLVDPDWSTECMADARWAPLHDLVAPFNRGELFAAPFHIRDSVDDGSRIKGAVTGFTKRPEGLDADDLAFLAAMADYAAVAISYARMFRRLREASARDERHRLSMELHDSVVQELFSISLRTKTLRAVRSNIGEARLDDELEAIDAQVQETLQQMRSLVVHGRAVEVGALGLVQALQIRCAAMSEQARIPIGVRASSDPELEQSLKEDAFMVVIEAVRNAINHASADQILVRVDCAGDGRLLAITVDDDGVGMPSRPRGAAAVGIDSMLERVENHHGRLRIASRWDAPRPGTRVHLELPITSGRAVTPAARGRA
jgi:signal transduction histidine kinase